MSGLVRTAHRVLKKCVQSSSLSSGIVSRTQVPVKRDFTRGIWHMSCSKRMDSTLASNSLLHNHSNTCSCGCGLKAMHTKGERELVEFLTEEIVAERKAQKMKTLPTQIDGFVIKGDGAEVTLTKQVRDETIKITFNVNHTVDTEDFGEDMQADKQEFSEMRSKPQFHVEVVRGDAIMAFTCSFHQEPPATNAEEHNDIFGIDEVMVHKEAWKKTVYAVAGDLLDSYLYDLLLNILEEKGISNEFVQKLGDFATAYEHNAYINLLEGISKFTIGK